VSRFADYEPRTGSDGPAPAFDTRHVRPARPDDIEPLVGLMVGRHGGDPDEARERWRAEIEGTLKTDKWVLLVAEVDGEVVGFGRLRHEPEPHGSEEHPAPAGWFLMGIIIHPDWRRRGIGHALTQARLDRVREVADEAWYFANRANRASIDMHARFGFEPVPGPFGYPRADLSVDEGALYRARLA
jgi:ribosomal protein S18 acetylase RimI-like enzyme